MAGVWRAKPRIPRGPVLPKPTVRQLDRSLTALQQRLDRIEALVLQTVRRGRA